MGVFLHPLLPSASHPLRLGCGVRCSPSVLVLPTNHLGAGLNHRVWCRWTIRNVSDRKLRTSIVMRDVNSLSVFVVIRDSLKVTTLWSVGI